MSNKRKRDLDDNLSADHTSKKIQATAVYNPRISGNYLPFSENPTGDELKREVALYERLASEDNLERIDAADAIVSGLIGTNETTESTLLRHLERKLFRGLASGRKCARLGYSVVLTEILSELFKPGKENNGSKYPTLHFDKIFLLLKAKTKPEGDLSGQEVKDHSLGFLFGLQCFVRARILLLDTERWVLVLKEIFGLAKKKSWIKEECGWMIVEALEQMNQEQAQLTLQILCEEALSKSSEGVGIWIEARKKFPSINFESLPKVWGHSANPLSHLKSLAKAMKESSKPDNNVKSPNKTNKFNQTGNWNAKLHFTWDILLEQYVTALENENHNSADEFRKFWKVVVDDNLFGLNASRERKFWGFLVFQKVLQNTRTFSFAISSIFSPNLMRCLINHSQDKDRFLNRAADKSLKSIIAAVQSNPQILPEVLQNLIAKNGNYNFDKVTKTKTISQLLDLVSESNIEKTLLELEYPATVVSRDDNLASVKEAESRRLMFSDYLLQIARKRFSKTSGEITETSTNPLDAALSAFFMYAYGDIEGQPAISEKTRTLFQNRLSSAFTLSLTDLGDYKYACNLLKESVPAAVKMDSGLENVHSNAISTMRRILKKLKKASDDDKTQMQAMALLYALITIQLYNGEAEAVTCLGELDLCYQKLVKKKSEQSKSKASEVLVELLLSFISRPSALLRKVAQLVFGAFVSSMTKEGLEILSNVLSTSESIRGQQELFDQNDEEVSEEDVEDTYTESDLKVIDMDIEDAPSIDATSDEQTTNIEIDSADETDQDIEEESVSDDQEVERLNLALVDILKTNPDAANADDDDEDMTDSEMMALDSKLEEIFSQRKATPNKKKEQKDAVENIINFKTRVLDLLEIYVKKQTHDELAFELILPLLALIRTTKVKKLADKAHGIILSFARAYKSLNDSILTIPSDRVELLRKIHEEARKNSSHAFCKAASSASLLVVSSMFRVDTGLLKAAADIYCETQLKWVWGQALIQAAFFTEWINWCQSHKLNV